MIHPARHFFTKIGRGEMRLVKLFWVAHVLVWGVGIFLFQFLSTAISMTARPLVGIPLGLLFVLYNITALSGVIRSARSGDYKLVIKIGAIVVSGLLAIFSLWVPVFFWGMPIYYI